MTGSRGCWRTGERAWSGPTLLVQYFGRVFADRDVPWHYPWFYFAATVPLGLQLLGLAWASFKVGRTAGATRSLCCWPGHDRGVSRDFQHEGADLRRRTPVLARLSGLGALDRSGFSRALEPLSFKRRSGHRFRIILTGFLLVQGYGTVLLHPFGLSFYNGLAGGLAGAERLGLELTYWNDAVDQVLLDRLAREGQPGDTAALVPTLYPQQGLLTTNRALCGPGSSCKTSRKAGARSGSSCPVEPRTGRTGDGSPPSRAEMASASRSARGKAFGCRHFGIFHNEQPPRNGRPR